MDNNAGEHLEFFMEIREKLQEIQDIAYHYGLGDDFAYISIAGIYIESDTDEGNYNFKAMTDFFIGDEEELDRLLQVGIDTYRQTVRRADSADSLDDLLGEFGISTEDDEQ